MRVNRLILKAIPQLLTVARSLVQVLKSQQDEPVDLEALASLLYGIYGEEVIEKVEQVLEKESPVEKAWRAEDHPRGKNGRFIPKGSTEARATAADEVAKAIAGDRSSSPQRLMSHLSLLTVKQIRDLARKHGKKVPSAIKSNLMESLRALVGGAATPVVPYETSRAIVPVEEKKPQAKPQAKPEGDKPETFKEKLATPPSSLPKDELQPSPHEREVAAGKVPPVSDFGRFVPGARKHGANKTGTRPKKDDAKKTKPRWMAQYEVHQDAKTGKYFVTIGKKKPKRSFFGGSSNFITDSNYKVRDFDTAEEAVMGIKAHALANQFRITNIAKPKEPDNYAIVKLVGNNRPVVQGGFSSEEDARKHMVANADEVLNHRFPDWEAYSYLDDVKRVGPERRKGKISEKDFERDFNFSGGVFGNWETNKDGVTSINHAYDALHDLADVLGMSPRDMSLNGRLAIGFGSHGTGGLNSAKAHYDPEHEFINLTKMKGAGSLAHEWFHALDHQIARMVHGEKSDKLLTSSMVRHASDEKTQELVDAWRGLVDVMTKKDGVVAGSTDVELNRKKVKMRSESMSRMLDRLNDTVNNRAKKPLTGEEKSEWDSLLSRVKDGDIGERVSRLRSDTGANIARLNELFKKATGRSFDFDNQDSNNMGRDIYWTAYHLNEAKKSLSKAESGSGVQGKIPTSFLASAVDLDNSRASDYYQLPHELAARAFSSYIEDKLAERKMRSDYLSAKSSNEHYSFHEIYGKNGLTTMKPFPEGDERKAINAAFDRLFDVVNRRYVKRG